MGWLDFFVMSREKPEQLIRKWTLNLRREERELERQLQAIDSEERKVKTLIKQAAKRGDRPSCFSLAKELIHSRRAKERLFINKAQLNSLALQLQQQLAHTKMIGSLEKSSDLMRIMNRLVKVPELHRNMENMSREMIHAGLIDEIVDQGMDVLDENITEEAELEANRLVTEITSGILEEATMVREELPSVLVEQQSSLETTKVPQADRDLTRIRDRLNSLKHTN